MIARKNHISICAPLLQCLNYWSLSFIDLEIQVIVVYALSETYYFVSVYEKLSFEISNRPVATTPVSYTHLDVYKRQEYCFLLQHN